MIAASRSGDAAWPIGRDDDLATLTGLVEQHRLVTVTGLGGVGKTRLVQAYVEQTRGRTGRPLRHATIVDLAPVSSTAAVAGVIAAALDLVEDPATDMISAIAAALEGPAASVLVLDNLEHVLDARELVAHLLDQAPTARIVATSRLPLAMDDERVLQLAGLAVPTGPSDVAAAPAGALFLQRARQRGATSAEDVDDAAAIVEICRLLDGLPLAIELAAAWSRMLTPRAILRRLLDERLELAGGSHPRQASMSQIVASTVDLLPPDQREIFPALAVFAGSFDEAAAGFVTGKKQILSVLRSFEEAALVRVSAEPDGEPRFDLLETIRAVAQERQQASGRVEELQTRHIAYFSSRAVEAANAIRSSSFGDHSAGRKLADPNVVVALERAIRRADGDSAVRLAAALATRGIQIGFLREPVARLKRALALPGATDGIRSDGLNALVSLRGELHDLDDQVRDAREAVALARAARSPERIVRTLVTLGNWSPPDALQAYAEAAELAVEIGYTWGASSAWMNLANTLWNTGRHEEALAASKRSGDAERAMGNATGIAESLSQQGGYELDLGRIDAALAHLAESAAIFAAHPGLPFFITVTLSRLAMAQALSGDGPAAEATLLEAAGPVEAAETPRDIQDWLHAAVVVLAADHPLVAARCLGVIEPSIPGDEPGGAVASRNSAATSRIAARVGRRRLEAERVVGANIGARAVFRQVTRLLRRARRRDRGFVDAPFGRLTIREQEVLAMLGEGVTDRGIAERLGISPKTASVHVANVKAKLGVETRVAAVLAAREVLGLGDAETPAGEWSEGRRA